MSQAPSMPMYWDVYLAETTHLTTEEHGAYMLLMAAIWRRNGSVPDNDRDNARILGLTPDTWHKVKARILPFLRIEEGNIRSTYADAVVIWLKMDNRRSIIPKEIRDLVYLRDGEKCVYCGTTEAEFHLDHVFPLSRGGDHSAANLAVSCASCNRSKGDKTIEEWGGRKS